MHHQIQSTNKASGVEIPLQILRHASFSFEELKKYVNHAILKVTFPDSLEQGDITPVHKKEEPTDKSNFRPVSVLSLLSKFLKSH